MNETWNKLHTWKNIEIVNTVKPVLSGHSKRRPNIVYSDQFLLNAGQKYCRMLQESILQYFQPSLSYHLSFRTLLCLFLSGRLRHVLLYQATTVRQPLMFERQLPYVLFYPFPLISWQLSSALSSTMSRDTRNSTMWLCVTSRLRSA